VKDEQTRADVAAAVQGAIARQLADRSLKAMRLYAAEHGGAGRLFVVAGGVAANGEVRRRLQATAEAEGFAFLAPPLAYCTDNAAMIALAGAERIAAGLVDGMDALARPRWPWTRLRPRPPPSCFTDEHGAKAEPDERLSG
jgi:N6-L-threonylcarbamoyladenine synthase